MTMFLYPIRTSTAKFQMKFDQRGQERSLAGACERIETPGGHLCQQVHGHKPPGCVDTIFVHLGEQV